MTIGIACVGPNAGRAVFDALALVERIGRGAIRGFVAYAAVAEGEVHRRSTQRGGTSTLFTDGERVGLPPPDVVAGARVAALMSSGPDRPEPLSQFVAAEPGGALVTGHRLPNAPASGGEPLNLEVLRRMQGHESADAAVQRIMAENQDADAGVIAVDRAGAVALANAPRVQVRPDQGSGYRELDRARVAVLHNAIWPRAVIAELAIEAALDTMLGLYAPTGHIRVSAGTPLTHGQVDAVEVDADGRALRIVTRDSRLFAGQWNCAAIYLGSEVRAGSTLLGHTTGEPNCMVVDGTLVSLSGQDEADIPYRTPAAGAA